MNKKLRLIGIVVLSVLIAAFLYAVLSQILIPHKKYAFVPDYEMLTLTEQSSDREIFLQTGLGKSAAERVKATQGLEGLKKYQKTFFAPRETYCKSLLSFFTKSDRLKEGETPQSIAELMPGDILVTLSNHSLGWRHGHAGIVVMDGLVLESPVMGEKTKLYDAAHWESFSQYAVLRLKNADINTRKQIADYAYENLMGLDYKLTMGIFGEKAPEIDEDFGVQCTYLVWYAYNHFGFDIDSDKGKLISTYDILHSPLLEVVQLYGMNPLEFAE